MIHLDAVIKSFGTLRAVDGLTLHVQPGQVLGLLGPNGAGKTTTISMATGLLAPDAGTIRISGHNPRDAHARAHIGVAPQSLALYDELSARENLSFFAAIFALHGRERTARVDEALALVGLADRQRDRVAHFSGGMKRRLNLAAAVLHHPKVVFMDEPTAGVDPHSRNAIFDIVRTLQAKGCTIVYSTHYMEEAEKLCDRVAIIDRGKLLADGSVPQLLADHGGPSVVEVIRTGMTGTQRIESTDPVRTLATVAASDGGSSRVVSARIHGPTLESVFLHLTGRSLRD